MSQESWRITSKDKGMLVGVPQGSTLGPLLFFGFTGQTIQQCWWMECRDNTPGDICIKDSLQKINLVVRFPL
jgi:hypothetical protein